jgi:hypothetical protein
MKASKEIVYNKEQKKKLKVFKIPVDLYQTDVVVMFPDECEKLNKLWKKDMSSYGAETTDYMKDNLEVSVKFYDKPVKLVYAVHEFAHATQMILNHVGHEYQDKVDEPFAYLLHYITKEFIKLCKKENIKLEIYDKTN